jgi:hypothetical protein
MWIRAALDTRIQRRKVKRTALILLPVLLLVLVPAILLMGCEQGSETRREAERINEASDLPLALLSSPASANPADYEDYFQNFTSLDYYGKDFILRFSGFPTAEDDYFLTEIEWTGGGFDLFGVKIGDDLGTAVEALEAQGYALTGSEHIAEFEKNGITIRLTGDTAVEEFWVHIPTEYDSDILY